MIDAGAFAETSSPIRAAATTLALAGVAPCILDLGRGGRLTLIGLDRKGIGDALRAEPATRGALMLAPGPGLDAASVADRLLDDLSALALQRWPAWYGHDDASAVDLPAQAPPHAPVSAPWLRAALKRVAAGRPPRFPRVARRLELTQLLNAVEPAGLILIAAPDPVVPRRAAAVIDVLEWGAACGAATVVVFPTWPLPVPPFDRVLYGALEVEAGAEPAPARFIAPRSRAHPGSAIEARVEAALRRDPELGPLFSCNEIVPLSGLATPPRVDLLWREGRVVVELDGPEHQGDAKFGSDRHRDYALLVAGYLVLRLTNAQVDTDLQQAIEKIRAVVRFRRSGGVDP